MHREANPVVHLQHILPSYILHSFLSSAIFFWPDNEKKKKNNHDIRYQNFMMYKSDINIKIRVLPSGIQEEFSLVGNSRKILKQF